MRWVLVILLVVVLAALIAMRGKGKKK